MIQTLTHKILVVDDQPDVQLLVKKSLEAPGQEILIASTTQKALEQLDANPVSLILLDIHLDKEDGFLFFSELQKNSRTKGIPVIFLTGSDNEVHKVAAFSLGAEDYVVKPFSPLELRARVEARLKKISAQRSGQVLIQKGNLTLNSDTFTASITQPDTTPVHLNLSVTEFRLLKLLMENEDHVLQREQIVDAVWSNRSEIFDRTVDAHIYGLRKKLGAFALHIESVHGVGYRFVLNPPHKKDRS